MGIKNTINIKSGDFRYIKKETQEEIDLYNMIDSDPYAYRASIKFNI